MTALLGFPETPLGYPWWGGHVLWLLLKPTPSPVEIPILHREGMCAAHEAATACYPSYGDHGSDIVMTLPQHQAGIGAEHYSSGS